MISLHGDVQQIRRSRGTVWGYSLLELRRSPGMFRDILGIVRGLRSLWFFRISTPGLVRYWFLRGLKDE